MSMLVNYTPSTGWQPLKQNPTSSTPSKILTQFLSRFPYRHWLNGKTATRVVVPNWSVPILPAAGQQRPVLCSSTLQEFKFTEWNRRMKNAEQGLCWRYNVNSPAQRCKAQSVSWNCALSQHFCSSDLCQRCCIFFKWNTWNPILSD